MKRKLFIVDLFDENLFVDGTVNQPIDAEFHSSDTEAFLEFEPLNKDFIADSAVISLYNKDNGSIVSQSTSNSNLNIVNGVVKYRMPKSVIAHFGKWQAQVIFSKGVKNYTTPIVSFDVGRYMMDARPTPLEMVESWSTLYNNAQNLLQAIATWDEDFAEKYANLEAEYATELTGVKSQLAQTESQVGLKPEVHGVLGDGSADDSTNLQQMIDSAGGSAITLSPNKKYLIKNSLTLNSDTVLYGNNSVIIIDADIDGIVYPANAYVDNLNIEIKIDNYSKTAFKIDDESGFNVLTKNGFFGLNLIGKGVNGNAIGVDDDGEQGVVCYLKAENISIYDFEKGVTLTNSHAESWYNGNVFKNVTMYNCKHFIDLLGTCDGNDFSGVQIQPTTNTESIIRTDGRYNKFNAIVWDLHRFDNVDLYDFTNALYNEINLESHDTNRSGGLVSGLNPANTFNRFTNDGVVFPKIGTESSYITSKSGSSIHVYKNYIGNQDDVLTMFDKVGDIEITGKQPDTGLPRVLFRTNRDSISWNNLNPSEEVTIRLSNSSFRQIDVLGVIFTALKPDYVKIVATHDTATVKEFHVNNLQDIVVYRNDLTLDTYNSLIIKFGVYTTKTVQMSRIFMSSRRMNQTTFIQTDGGTMYENLRFGEAGKGIILKTPDGTKDYRLTVSNGGNIVATEL